MFDARKLLDALTAAASEGTEKVRTGADDLPGLARDIFGNAKDGVATAARDIDAKTGAGAKIDELVRELSGGQGAEDLLNRAKDWAGDNKVAAGSILGGLGALLLGTRSGRSLSMGAAKLGGLVLIGGLAYGAYKRHAAGGGAAQADDAPTKAKVDVYEIPAPDGSGFEADALGNDDAQLYVQAMIAAAAADGVVDSAERSQILSGLKQAGMDSVAISELERLFANPPSIEQLAAGRPDAAQASRIYTAARLAIEPDTSAERTFLSRLADALRLDPAIAMDIDTRVGAVRA